MIAVVAFPQLDDTDRAWIDAIRHANDPQAGRIAPHFTLVFPAAEAADACSAPVAKVVSASAQIAFSIRGASTIADATGTGTHLFLVLDEGSDAMTQLHDRLYDTDMFRRHLRTDIPYVPHLTVAASHDAKHCETLARDLNAGRPNFRGVLTSVDILEITAAHIRSVASIPLRLS